MLKNKLITSLMFLFIATSLSSCATTHINNNRLNTNAQQAFKKAETYIGSKKIEEGLSLLSSVNVLHGDDKRVKELLEKIPDDKKHLLEKRNELLGYNKHPFRRSIVASTGRKILFYIPDRIKDFAEIFTAEINLGYTLGVGLWATRGAQAIVYSGATMGVGLYQKEGLGARGEGSGELGIGPFVAVGLANIRGGTGGYALTATGLALHLPKEQIYQEYRDYWAFGGKVGLLVVGAEAEIHPIEIADFITGVFGYDLLEDDWATSRGLKLSSHDKKIMKELGKDMRNINEASLVRYREQFPTLFLVDYAEKDDDE